MTEFWRWTDVKDDSEESEESEQESQRERGGRSPIRWEVMGGDWQSSSSSEESVESVESTESIESNEIGDWRMGKFGLFRGSGERVRYAPVGRFRVVRVLWARMPEVYRRFLLVFLGGFLFWMLKDFVISMEEWFFDHVIQPLRGY
jgi:hypothetical protein